MYEITNYFKVEGHPTTISKESIVSGEIMYMCCKKNNPSIKPLLTIFINVNIIQYNYYI